jgi:thymidine kinase
MTSLSIVPSIDLIMGPMYSGKSSELIRRVSIYHEMDMKVLYVNSIKDNRSSHSFSTHNSTIGKLPCDSLKTDSLSKLNISKYEVIAIDEGQLFPDLKDTVIEWVEKQSKIVLVSGLNGDFQRKPFGQIQDLLPYCDNILKLKSFCLPCKKNFNVITDALFTKRIVESKDTVLIGGKDAYVPACRKCFLTEMKESKSLDILE